jgi:hypothetical protein
MKRFCSGQKAPFGGAGMTLLILLLGIMVGGFMIFALVHAGVILQSSEKDEEKLLQVQTQKTLLDQLLPIKNQTVNEKIKELDVLIAEKKWDKQKMLEEVREKIQELQILKRKMEAEEKQQQEAGFILRQEKDALEKIKADIEFQHKTLEAVLEDELVKIKQMESESVQMQAKVWSKMDAEAAAELIMNMNENELKQAAQVMFFLKDRKQAEIIQALNEQEKPVGTKRAINLSNLIRKVKFEVATNTEGMGGGP